MNLIRLKAYAMIAFFTLVRLLVAIALSLCEVVLLDVAPIYKFSVVLVYLFCIRVLLLIVR